MTNIVSFPALGLEFNVHPVAFSIGGLHIYWYGIIIAAAFGLALLYCMPRAKKLGLNADRVVDVVIAGTIGGVVGARVYYVIFAWEEFADDLSRIFRTWEGGMAIYGGLIGAVALGLAMAKLRHVKAMPMLDLAASGFLIGQGIGRWGNFINQEAFGSNTTLPWGMTSSNVVNYLSDRVSALEGIGVTVDPYAPVHPCFLYESIWCLVGVLVLHLYTRHRKFDGELFCLYLGWYGLGRAVIEGLRTDSLMLGTMRVSQLLSILLVIVAVVLIVSRRMRIRRSGDPELATLYVDTQESKDMLSGAYDEAEKARKAAKKAEEDSQEKAEETPAETETEEADPAGETREGEATEAETPQEEAPEDAAEEENEKRENPEE